jgi:hypothetical protein
MCWGGFGGSSSNAGVTKAGTLSKSSPTSHRPFSAAQCSGVRPWSSLDPQPQAADKQREVHLAFELMAWETRVKLFLTLQRRYASDSPTCHPWLHQNGGETISISMVPCERMPL